MLDGGDGGNACEFIAQVVEGRELLEQEEQEVRECSEEVDDGEDGESPEAAVEVPTYGESDCATSLEGMQLQDDKDGVTCLRTGVVIGAMHAFTGNIKATCCRPGHSPKTCFMWIGLNQHRPYDAVLKGAYLWLKDGDCNTEAEHVKLGKLMKQKWGVKVKL